jgi:hypothetical protein
MPPLAAKVTEYAEPTAPAVSELVVIDGAAGTVICAVPLFVPSAADVAVTVTVKAELEAAGAVYVALLAVPEIVPPPLTDQLTPALFLSFVTTADSVAVFVASTVVDEALTETLMGLETLVE